MRKGVMQLSLCMIVSMMKMPLWLLLMMKGVVAGAVIVVWCLAGALGTVSGTARLQPSGNRLDPVYQKPRFRWSQTPWALSSQTC